MTAVRLSKNLVDNGLLAPVQTVFLLCDLQEKFRPYIKHFDEITEGAKRLVKVAKIMDIPLIVTEQNPKSLGPTVADIDISHAAGFYGKTQFSMCTPEVLKHLNALKESMVHPSIVVFGIEAHICVEQTATHLRSAGWPVHIVADSTSSRSLEDRLLAFKRMQQIGCFIATSESIIFKLLADKNNPNFKNVQQLVKTVTPATGLNVL